MTSGATLTLFITPYSHDMQDMKHSICIYHYLSLLFIIIYHYFYPKNSAVVFFIGGVFWPEYGTFILILAECNIYHLK